MDMDNNRLNEGQIDGIIEKFIENRNTRRK
jgi:hypothetical protein